MSSFFSLKNTVRKIYLLKLSSWNFAVFWKFLSMHHPGTFSEGRCHLQPCSPCEYLVTIRTGFKDAFAGYGHKEAWFLHSQLWLSGQQYLSGSCVPKLSFGVECARTKPQKLMSHYFLFVFNLIFIFYQSKFDYNVVFVLGVQNLVPLYIYIYLFIFRACSHVGYYTVLSRPSLVHGGLWWLYILHVLVYVC